MKPLWIFGGSSYAEIAVHYFSRDTDYEVQGLILDPGYDPSDRLSALSLLRPDAVPDIVTEAKEIYFHVAVTYAGLNRVRLSKIAKLKELGMQPASYISPFAYVDDTVQIGEHCFIFEHNTIQPFVVLGSGVILWSGNHVGHHSSVEDGVFVSSQVVISGHCSIGERTFLGVNSSVANNVVVGRSNWVLPNTFLSQSTADDEFWKPSPSVKSERPPSARSF